MKKEGRLHLKEDKICGVVDNFFPSDLPRDLKFITCISPNKKAYLFRGPGGVNQVYRR